jgi:thiol-disulfide isomerase/thioredoxin
MDPTVSPTPSPRPRGIGLLFAVAVAAVIVALLWPRGSVRSTAPAGFLIDAGGRPTPLAREMKPVTLVHFWASWCPPCIEEIPQLLAFADGVHDDRFALLLVAVADRKEAAQAMLGRTRFPLYFDPQWEVAHRFGTVKVPETYVVIDGKVVRRYEGATDWRSESNRRLVLARLTS